MTTATQTTMRLPPEIDAMAPAEFMRQVRKLLKSGSASAIVGFYDQHGPAMLDQLSEAQQIQLEEIMHWADTVVELEADAAVPAGAAHAH